MKPCLGLISLGVLALITSAGCASAAAAETNGAMAAVDPTNTNSLPVRGLHLMAPNKKDVPALVAFIRDSLPKAGVNTLVIEFDYHYNFQSRPEFADPSAPGKAEVQQILKACRAAGVQLIPQINCLGHQSWAGRNGRFLMKHPEFDESTGKFPGNTNIYCRSYCPLHPGVHRVLFDLIDELAAACEAKAFHVGMDEVFILADPDCPRCHGKKPAELFANEVKTLHAHLAGIGCRTWMWGDRFLDAKPTGLGEWEASENGTAPAIDLVPKDVVICDWHYDSAPDTSRLFAEKGFDVVICPWRKTDVGLAELAQMKALRSDTNSAVARHAFGIMQTTWGGAMPFIAAVNELASGGTAGTNSVGQCASCFVTLFK